MSAEPQKSVVRSRKEWIVLSTIAVGVPLFCLLNYRTGSANRGVTEVSGAVTLAFLFPVMMRAMRKATDGTSGSQPRVRIAGAVLLAVASFMTVWVGTHVIPRHDDLMDLALNNVPLSEIQPERKRILVELIRRKSANSVENDRVIAEAKQHPLNPQVYTPESFASKAAMESTMQQLGTWISRDLAYNEKQQAATEDFRQKMLVCDPEFLRSFEEGMHDRDAADAKTLQLEQQWFESVKGLYGFAEANASAFRVEDGKLVIASDSIRGPFNQAMQKSKTMHDELEKSVQAGVAAQQKVKGQFILP